MSDVTANMPSPLGTLVIAASDAGITAIQFHDDPPALPGSDHALLRLCIEELDAYFQGQLRTFSVPLDLRGTPFQQRVWNLLLTIPYGATRTYMDLAERLGDRRAVRAVGAANGKNPVAIVVPCHRVIGSDGDLTGYAGGLWRKEWLLAHEGRPVQQRLFP